jgi:DNA helicase-2/ATP-dependent DNA helicase PcrA
MPFAPSAQQKAVYQWVKDGRGNMILVAVAGAGKTTTILNATTLMKGSVAIAAYNKKIADEITGKLKTAGVGANVKAGTFHSFGLRNWSSFVGRDKKVQIDGKKMAGIITQLMTPEELVDFTGRLVSMAKQRGMGVLAPMTDMMAWHEMVTHHDLDDSLPEERDLTDTCREELVLQGIDLSIRALRASTEMDRDVIDYDDMIFAPLFHKARVWQNQWLLVDEAQDTNPARRALAKKMLAPGGRAIFVGDPAQAIYGFTGADNDSLDIIKREFACTELPLTVTYRCPKAVVAEAQMYVSHIQAADTAPEGEVKVIADIDFNRLTADDINAEAAMLCRNTAPLVKMAFSLIRRGIACHVEGKAIGAGLLKLARKWKVQTLPELRTRLDDYLRSETEQFLAKGLERKAEALADKVETLFVIMDDMREDAKLSDLNTKIIKLFGDTPEDQPSPNFTLSTVHKSKGREWKTVYLLDRAKLMPSRFARQAWQMEQEKNLIYVAITRSQGTLIDVVTTR